jgi:hypothetical protein
MKIGNVKWIEFNFMPSKFAIFLLLRHYVKKQEKVWMQNIFKKTTLIFLFMIGALPAKALHPAQFSNQISSMLNEAGLYPALEVELDFMFNRETMQTTQRKLQQVRLARKHGISELAEGARKTLFSSRRYLRESRWLTEDAIESGTIDDIAKAISGVKERIDKLYALKTSFADVFEQWNTKEKEWTLMRSNDFAQFAEDAFFKMVRRHIYEPSNRKDPRLVPVLVDDLNYYISKVVEYKNYLKYKLNTLQ